MSRTIDCFQPGEVWPDASGAPIQAHGGGILKVGEVYYWYGEYKDTDTIAVRVERDGRSWFRYRTDVVGVSCYSSRDLLHWTFEGLALPAVHNDSAHDLHVSKVVERPKVVYNEKTRQYVMWMHVDSADYQYARAGVAVSDSPVGPFRYVGSVRPHGAMSRDMTLFKDDDGKAYLFYASEDNRTLYASLLADDYLSMADAFTRNFIDRSREAPAVFKRRGKYYMITSGCSSWDPNQAEAAVSESPLGPWESLGDPCIGDRDGTTFRSQSTHVLQVAEDAFIFMADRWFKENLRDSRYVWLPLLFADEKLAIRWHDRWDLSIFA